MAKKDYPITNGVFTRYAGNPLLNLQTLVIAAGLLFFLLIVAQVIIHDDYFDKNILFLPLSCMVVYFANASTFNYFLLSDSSLVIKNHCLPWKTIVYPLSNIQKLSYGIYHPTSIIPIPAFFLAVTTKSGRQKNYIAKSLGERQWKAFHNRLVSLKANVSDKAGYWD